ncbi:MAG: AAA family ATPase [Magnetococcales bacterium]|nr:AAA family ATPase [Magnetococcales bacterium]
MDQRWTLQVRNFGPIQSADIEIHPFMMFIGPNNSGKSYLSTLLWGLMTHGKLLFDDSIINYSSYNACLEWIEQEYQKAIKATQSNIEFEYISNFDNATIKLFIDLFNEVTYNKKNLLIAEIFNCDMIDINELKVTNYQRSSIVSIKWKYSEPKFNEFSVCQNQYTVYFSKTLLLKRQQIILVIIDLLFKGISNTIDSVVGLKGRYTKFSNNLSLYLPSARTGFMLNYKALASSTIHQGFSLQDLPKGLHTTPTMNFLQGLIEMSEDEQPGEYDDIVAWLENEVINGKFSRKDDVLPNYYYVPKSIQQPIPLHIASSLVTELSSLSIFLNNNSNLKRYLKPGSLFIEEPEAHLHPAAQRKMAQALVKLVNRGLPVWITTHSDIMFQQFNNLIALSHLPNRAETLKEMGYDESDVLDPDKAIAYEFVIEEGGTVVKPLDLMNTGFAAPSFNQTLGDLMAETIKLHDLLDDAEADAS